jgi:hypothetical protein
MSIAINIREAPGRAEATDWSAASADLDAQGWAVLPKLLSSRECTAIANLYDEGDGFRSHIVVAPARFRARDHRDSGRTAFSLE